MKYLLIVITAVFFAPTVKPVPPAASAPSPLAVFDKSWDNPVYASCNTAADASFMSDKEKELIYILNLARRYPAQFANTVVKQYPAWSHNEGMAKTDHYQSLLRTMRLLPQSTLLYPDEACYASAQCHAVASGKKGYIGHNRLNADCKKQQHFMGECCDYGHDEPIDILMALLVDEGVANLGHRLICFTTYNKIGVSMAPHKQYGNGVVLDFYY
jgi:hypothetical protein